MEKKRKEKKRAKAKAKVSKYLCKKKRRKGQKCRWRQRREYLEWPILLLSCTEAGCWWWLWTIAGGAESWWCRPSLGVKGTVTIEWGEGGLAARGLVGNPRCWTVSDGLVRLLHEWQRTGSSWAISSLPMWLSSAVAEATTRGGVREEQGMGVRWVVTPLTPPPLLPLRFDKRSLEKRGDQTGQDGNLHKSKKQKKSARQNKMNKKTKKYKKNIKSKGKKEMKRKKPPSRSDWLVKDK